MKTKEQIEELVDTCVKIYEMTMMNSDTPKLSGKHYMEYGFVNGYEQAQRDAEERENKLVEALKFYANKTNWFGYYQYCTSILGDDEKAKDEDDFDIVIGGRRARETLKELGVE